MIIQYIRNILSLLILFISLNVFGQVDNSELIIDMRSVSKESYYSNNLIINNHSEGLELTVKKGEKASLTFSSNNEYWDLTQWVFLSLELENVTDNEVRFNPVILYDNPKGINKKKKKHEHIGFLKANENLIYNCVLFRDQITASDYPQKKDFPGMRGIPNGVIIIWEGVDAKRLKGLKIVFPEQDFERKIVLKKIFKNRSSVPELYSKDKEAFFPFINKYGQYKHSNWNGKITDNNQFADAIKKETKELEKHKGSTEWNRFGGYANGPKFKATGNFRTQKIDGKWWLIDPDGYLFWSAGVNGAGKLMVATPYKGREHFFEYLPYRNKSTNNLYKGKSFMYGLNNLYSKYGENSEDEYVAISLNRMKSWGLNTLGGWSAESVDKHPEEIKLPYTVYISAIHPAINDKFPDVFDPEWKQNVEKKIMRKAEFVKNDPYFFGFFINNEIHWGTPYSLASNTLFKGKDSVGKKVYLELLKIKLKTIEIFNKKTGSNFKSWKNLLVTKVKKNSIKLNLIKDINELHYRNMTEKYFKTTRQLIDKHAPGKMYIGCRWHGNHKNKINVSIAAKYLDLLSFNAYENEVEFYPYPHKEIDKPFIISEFNFGALDTGKFFTGLGYASSQRNRGEKYQNFIKGALRNPRLVGVHWFMWANSTTAGRGNGENANCGLVSMTDQIYYELIAYMREINYTIYKQRLEL